MSAFDLRNPDDLTDCLNRYYRVGGAVKLKKLSNSPQIDVNLFLRMHKMGQKQN